VVSSAAGIHQHPSDSGRHHAAATTVSISGCGALQPCGAESTQSRAHSRFHRRTQGRARDTPYWRDCSNMSIPDTLAHQLELFRETSWSPRRSGCVPRRFRQVLVGQRIKANAYHHLAASGDEKLRTMLATLRAPSVVPSSKCRHKQSSTAIALSRTTGSSRRARSRARLVARLLPRLQIERTAAAVGGKQRTCRRSSKGGDRRNDYTF
jgi:hypothetical protein